MAFRSLQNGSSWCPKIMMSSTKNCKTVYYKMASPDPIFVPQNGGLYEGQPQPFCGGNGKGDGYRVSVWPKASQHIFLRAKFKQWKNATICSACPLTTRSVARLHTATICSACPLTTKKDPLHDFIPLRYAVHALWLLDPLHDFIFETWILHQIKFW